MKSNSYDNDNNKSIHATWSSSIVSVSVTNSRVNSSRSNYEIAHVVAKAFVKLTMSHAVSTFITNSLAKSASPTEREQDIAMIESMSNSSDSDDPTSLATEEIQHMRQHNQRRRRGRKHKNFIKRLLDQVSQSNVQTSVQILKLMSQTPPTPGSSHHRHNNDFTTSLNLNARNTVKHPVFDDIVIMKSKNIIQHKKKK